MLTVDLCANETQCVSSGVTEARIFICGKNELTNALTELDSSKILRELSKDNCDWISFNMNFAHSSLMGGSWERLIRSVRNALSSIFQKNGQQLDDDELFRTFTSEAEAIVNSIRLTYVDTVSPDSPVPISSMQLFTLKSKVLLPPPGVFKREDMYCHRRWRRVQYLADQFWSQWKDEYLPSLYQRNVWNKDRRNIHVGDVGLMIDESLPRCHWPMARVIEVHPSGDGRVWKVKIQAKDSTYEKPIQKIVLLMSGEVHNEFPRD